MLRNNVLKGIRHPAPLAPRYWFPNQPGVNDKFDPLTGTRYEVGSFGIIGKNPTNGIPVQSGTEGAMYYLSKFDTNGDAIWVLLNQNAPSGVFFLVDQVGTQVEADIDGNIYLEGEVVANGANPSSIPLEVVADAINNLLKFQAQVAKANTGAPANKNGAGFSSYDDSIFSVTEHGYVSLINPYSVVDVTASDTNENDDDGIRVVTTNMVADVQLTNRVQGSASTTIAGDTADITVASFDAAPFSGTAGTYSFNFVVSAFNASTPGGVTANLFGGVLTDGTTPTLIGQDEFADQTSLPGATATLAISGNDLVVRVTGVVGAAITWNMVGYYVRSV